MSKPSQSTGTALRSAIQYAIWEGVSWDELRKLVAELYRDEMADHARSERSAAAKEFSR